MLVQARQEKFFAAAKRRTEREKEEKERRCRLRAAGEHDERAYRCLDWADAHDGGLLVSPAPPRLVPPQRYRSGSGAGEGRHATTRTRRGLEGGQYEVT